MIVSVSHILLSVTCPGVSDSPDRSTLHSTNSTRTIMAEKEHSSLSSTAPTAHKSRRTGGAGLKCSPKAHYSSSPGLGDPSKPSASPLRALAGLVPPAATSGSEGRSGSSRPRGQSLGSAPNSRNKSTPVKRKVKKGSCTDLQCELEKETQVQHGLTRHLLSQDPFKETKTRSH